MSQLADPFEIDSTKRHYALPLIYRLEDEEFLSHFPEMTPQVLDSLRSEFELKAGVGELALDDPLYQVRWEQAEMTLQDRIRTLYGWAAWGDYERQIALKAEAEAAGARND